MAKYIHMTQNDSTSAYLHAQVGTQLIKIHAIYMAFDGQQGSALGSKIKHLGFRWDHLDNTVQYGGTNAWLMQISDDNVNWTDEHTFTWTHESDYTTEITWTPTNWHQHSGVSQGSSIPGGDM